MSYWSGKELLQPNQAAESHRTYYDARWMKENSALTPPNPLRVDAVVSAVREALATVDEPIAILDVGCGNGWILEAIQKFLRPAQLYGIEPSQVGCEHTQSRVPTALVYKGGLGEVDCGRAFDVVICSEVFEHIEDQETFLDQLAECVSDTGHLVMTTPNGRYRKTYFDFYGICDKAQPVELWVTPRQLGRCLRKYFRHVNIRSFDLSYWFDRNRRLRLILDRTENLKGGWRTYRGLESLAEGYFARGLYLLAHARGKR